MTFPDTPLDFKLELDINGTLINVAPYDTGFGILPNRLMTDPIPIDFGKPEESSTADPCEMVFRVDNRDGWFTPTDRRSPYYGGFGQGTKVYLSINDIVEFAGEVTDANPVYPEGDVAKVQSFDPQYLDLASVADRDRLGVAYTVVTVSGVLQRVGARQKALRSAMYREVVQGNLGRVSDYWSMEAGTVTSFCESGIVVTRETIVDMMSIAGFTLASDGDLAGSDTLPTAQSGADAFWNVRCFDRYNTQDAGWVFEQFVHIPEGLEESNSSIRWDVYTESGTHVKFTITVGFDGTGTFIRIRSFNAAGATLIDSTNTTPVNLVGRWVDMRLSTEQLGGNVGWALAWAPVAPSVTLDGFASVVGVYEPVVGATGLTAGTCGHPNFLRCEVVNAPPGGFSTGHVMVHDGIYAGWISAAASGWSGEPSLSRFFRVCAQENINTGYDAGDFDGIAAILNCTRMGIQRPIPVLDMLYECERAEVGIIHDARDAVGLMFMTRFGRYNRGSTITLDAQQSHIHAPLDSAITDQSIVDDVTITREGGTTSQMVDTRLVQDPPVGIGRFNQGLTVSLDDDFHVRHHAGWRLHMGITHAKELHYRTVSLNLAQAPGLISWWQARQPGHRFKIENLPPQHPFWPAVDLFIEGWHAEIGPWTWTVDLNCASFSPWIVGVYDDPSYGRWAVKNATLASSLTATATTIQVTTPGVHFTTDAGVMPFNLVINDVEVVTVTAITGTGPVGTPLTQTMTVVRNVNRLGRVHSLGEPVQFETPSILGL